MTSVADVGVTSNAGYRRRSTRIRVLWIALGILILAVSLLASVRFGSRSVDAADVLAVLGGNADDSLNHAAISRRLPRTLLAALTGAALAVSGLAMQGVTRNPLADPGILGVNMGAALAIVVGMAYFGLASATGMIWTAIGGAAVTAVGVYIVGSVGYGAATPLKLALSGAAISAALSSVAIAIVLPRNDIAGGVRSWQIGGVGGATWEGLRQMSIFLIVGFLICWATARGMNSLALGDELAAGLGEHVLRMRLLAASGAVILCGAATALAGPIGFVGLVIPHMCRLLIGVDHRWLVPLSAVLGAALLTASDVVGRVITPQSEISVGIITAFLGAPLFIAIVRRQRIRAV